MFTGIVEDVGRVERIEELDGGRRFSIGTGLADAGLREGASVAVDGACLTVVSRADGRFEVEAIGTTLSRTVAAEYGPDTRVNLERALAVGDRVEGHLVQGHVDGVGEVLDVREAGIHHLLDLRLPAEVWEGTVLHGSIAVNGVSLTVNAMDPPDRCQVALIPHTWSHTNLSGLRPGERVNLEADLIGKYVGKYVAKAEPGAGVPHGLPPQTRGGSTQ